MCAPEDCGIEELLQAGLMAPRLTETPWSPEAFSELTDLRRNELKLTKYTNINNHLRNTEIKLF